MIAKVLHDLAVLPVRAGLTLASAAEALLVRPRPLRWPPLLIVGPPRCGTTLLGQVVCSALDVAYLPMLAVRLRKSWQRESPAVLVTALARALGLTRQPETFASEYGSVKELGGSADADLIWRRVLGDEPLAQGALTRAQAHFLRRVTAGVERLCGRPYVEKCVGHAIRIPAVLEVFPDALWVRCRRAPLPVAQSVWLGRTAGRQGLWSTPKAKGWERLVERPLVELAAGQQWLFERAIDAGLESVEADRRIEVDHADVCRSPRAELERVVALLQRFAVPVRRRHALPESFSNPLTRRVPVEIHDALRAHVERLWGGPVERLRESDRAVDARA